LLDISRFDQLDGRAIALLSVDGDMHTAAAVAPTVASTTAGRNRLVMDHVQLVRVVACRLSHRLPASIELSELIAVGTLALVDAAGRYRPALGVPFEAFARQRVHGAMLDSLRGLDWAPRSLRKKQRAIDAAIGKLRNSLGREPDSREIAKELGLSESDYEKNLDDVRAAELATVRLAGGANEGDSLVELAVEPGDDQCRRLERAEIAEQLAAAIARLPERERQVLSLYYEEEMTLAEVGVALGVSESRISQLRTQAIARLRASLRDYAGSVAH
jgi:RNA polymerase sigma factor for flagellar operon FliA